MVVTKGNGESSGIVHNRKLLSPDQFCTVEMSPFYDEISY